MQELSEEKQKSMDTLVQIAEIEEYYQVRLLYSLIKNFWRT